MSGRVIMEIRTQISFNAQYLPANIGKQPAQNGVSAQVESGKTTIKAVEKKQNEAGYAPNLKEVAGEMLSESEKLGAFKNKEGLEETKDVKVGPDIRFALRSKNPDFLQRILWGPLTVAEYREVKYRLQEINQQALQNSNNLSGKIISDDELKGKEEKAQGVKSAPMTVDISV